MSKYWLPWLVGMPAETSFAVCSMIFSTLFDKLPKLRVCFAHGGGAFCGTIGRISHGYECRPDLVAVDGARHPREYLGKFWLDSLVHDPLALKHIVSLVGEKKVCLGTDYPFPLGEAVAGKLVDDMDENEMSAEVKQKVLWNNGLDFLGLTEWEDYFLGKTEVQPKRVFLKMSDEIETKRKTAADQEDIHRLSEQVQKQSLNSSHK